MNTQYESIKISNLYKEKFYNFIKNEAEECFKNNHGVIEKNINLSGLTNSENKLIKTLTSIYSPSYIFANLIKDLSENSEELNDILIFYKNEVIVISDKAYTDIASNAQCHWENKFFKSDVEKPKFLKGFVKSFYQLKKAKEYIEEKKDIFLEKNNKLLLTELHTCEKIHLITRYSGFSENAEDKYFQPNLKTTLVKESKSGTKFLHLPNVLEENIFYHTFDDITFNFLVNTFNTLDDLFGYINKREEVFSFYIENDKPIEIVNEELLIKSYQTKNDSFWLKKFDKLIYDKHTFNEKKYDEYCIKNNFYNINDLSQIIDWMIFYFSSYSKHYYKVLVPYCDKNIVVEHRHALNLLSNLNRYERKEMTISLYLALNSPLKIFGDNLKFVYIDKKLDEDMFVKFVNNNSSKLLGLTIYIMKEESNEDFVLALTNLTNEK